MSPFHAKSIFMNDSLDGRRPRLSWFKRALYTSWTRLR